MSNMVNKQKWIEDTALFYFRIFSGEYCDDFLNKLLKGGGGNSTLCASWYQLSPIFVPNRVSNTALKLLREKGFNLIIEESTVKISSKQINDNHGMFYNNAKGASNRINKGKLFHFDHNPSNKKILSLLNKKVKEYMLSKISEVEILQELAEYLKTIQTVDLITVEQDDIRTSTDRAGVPLTNEERDALLNDSWFSLEFIA